MPASLKSFTDYLTTPVKNSIFVEPATSEDILNLIHSLNINKSCGADGISPQLLKSNSYLFAEPLKYIYKLSLMQGCVPIELKIAKVIPIFKKGDTKQPPNYRPISSLS